MKLTNGQYDALNKFNLVILPAFGSLYFGLGGLWGLPAVEQVSGTVLLVSTFLGVVIKVLRGQYDASDESVHGDLMIMGGAEEATSLIAFNAPPTQKPGEIVKLRVKELNLDPDDA